jgi:formylglycine-generating enzyme required for sulfatase activity
MNKKLIFGVAVFFLITVLCGASKKWEIPYIVNFNKRFVQVDKNLYADRYETTVKDYQLFLREKREAGVDYSLLIYDSTCWRSKSHYNEPYAEYYFNYSAFADCPICCVPHYAANEFCKWLTEKYEKSTIKKKYKKVVFRLPTETEYRKAAISIYDSTKIFYPWGHNWLYDCKKGKFCNYHDGGCLFYLKCRNRTYTDGNGYILPVRSFRPNPYGLYNIVGNVSEMIQEEGIAMGGDWLSTAYNVRITSKKKYEKPSATVGFRVFMKIIEF